MNYDPIICGRLNQAGGSKNIELSLADCGVLIACINAEGSRVNLLSAELMQELDELVSQLESGSLQIGSKSVAIAGLVFISGKPDSFIAGADIKEILKAQSLPSEIAFKGCQDGKALFARISKLPMVTVAAIHGRCLGGGTELALACRFRLATCSKSTVFGLPEVGLGVLPGWGGSVKTPKLVGFLPALSLMLNPLRPWSARKAWRLGLVSELVSKEMLVERAVALALTGRPRTRKQSAFNKAARQLGDSRPVRALASAAARLFARLSLGKDCPAPAAVLEVMNAAFDVSEPQAFEMESAAFARLVHTAACARFVQKFLNYQKSKKKSA